MRQIETRFDAVVIGGGPSGAVAARQLAQRGRSVLLVDRRRPPRDKICGCCLNQAALAQLRAIGLGDLPGRLGAVPLTGLRLLRKERRARVPLPPGAALSRGALDTALLQAAADAGVELLQGCGARVLRAALPSRESNSADRLGGNTVNRGLFRIALGSGGLVESPVVVVADGLGGTSLKDWAEFTPRIRPASRLGFGGLTQADAAGPEIAEGQIEMVCADGGYLGAVRLEDGRIDFAAACDPGLIKACGGVAAAAERLAESAGVAGSWPLDQVKQWCATPALTRARPRLASAGLFVVGDAAGYVEPFTGEGMAWAIAGGAAVAPLADAAVDTPHPSIAHEWTRLYRRRIAKRQWGCRLVSQLLRRPRLVSVGMRAMTLSPRAAGALIRHATAAPPAGVVRPVPLGPTPPPLDLRATGSAA